MENKNELPLLRLPVIVEGRYDKSAILGMYRATVITTDGFGVFNSKEKQALIKRLAKDGIILLTDPDGGGVQIRSFISGIVPKEKIYHLYVPKIAGKEKRKTHASRSGLLGVEGVGGDRLRAILDPFVTDGELHRGDIIPADLYMLGLSGSDDSAAARDRLCEKLALPGGMSAKALLAALNVIADREELLRIMESSSKY